MVVFGGGGGVWWWCLVVVVVRASWYKRSTLEFLLMLVCWFHHGSSLTAPCYVLSSWSSHHGRSTQVKPIFPSTPTTTITTTTSTTSTTTTTLSTSSVHTSVYGDGDSDGSFSAGEQDDIHLDYPQEPELLKEVCIQYTDSTQIVRIHPRACAI